jgi:Tfp pilus assembly protein PilP
MWQQDSHQYAILSAGPHGTKVRLGQRVTQEGHRVVAIAEDSVSLRLAREPVIKLNGMGPASEGYSMGSEKR